MIHALLQSESDVDRPPSDWLAPAEIPLRDTLPATRRQAWMLGRWTAKRLLQRLYPHLRLAEIILAADRSGRPHVQRPSAISGQISLAHSGRYALCAVRRDGGPLGVDIEITRPFDGNFVRRALSAGEQLQLRQAPAGERNLLTTAFWSMKEAVVKLIGRPTLNPAAIDCRTAALIDGWQPFAVSFDDRQFAGVWRSRPLVQAIAVDGGQPPIVTLVDSL